MLNKLLNAGYLCTLSFLLAGCYTELSVNVRNGSNAQISVASAQPGIKVNEFKISPARCKKIPHGYGDLIVATESAGKLRFHDVCPFHVDQGYLVVRNSIFGPGYVTLNVVLETNMQLYVLSRTKKPLLKQPFGYPKHAQVIDKDGPAKASAN